MAKPKRYLVRIHDREDGSSLIDFLYARRDEATEWYEALLEAINPVTCYVTIEDLWQ